MKQQHTTRLKSQIQKLSRAENGFHFNASAITAEKMKDLNIEKISEGIQKHAPDVWELVGCLLEADSGVTHRREKARAKRELERKTNRGVRKSGKKGAVWEEDDDESHVSRIVGENEDEPEDVEDQLEVQRRSLLRIVRCSIQIIFTIAHRLIQRNK